MMFLPLKYWGRNMHCPVIRTALKIQAAVGCTLLQSLQRSHFQGLFTLQGYSIVQSLLLTVQKLHSAEACAWAAGDHKAWAARAAPVPQRADAVGAPCLSFHGLPVPPAERALPAGSPHGAGRSLGRPTCFVTVRGARPLHMSYIFSGGAQTQRQTAHILKLAEGMRQHYQLIEAALAT